MTKCIPHGMFQGGLLYAAKQTYKTLEEAIAKHDEVFSDMSG